MKKNTFSLFAVLLFSSALVMGCKKPKEGGTPSPTPSPSAGPTALPSPTAPPQSSVPPELYVPRKDAIRPYVDSQGFCWSPSGWELEALGIAMGRSYDKNERAPLYLRDRELATDRAIQRYPHLFKTKSFSWGECVAVVPDPGSPQFGEYELLTNRAIADELRKMNYCIAVESTHYVAVAKQSDSGAELYQGVASVNTCLRRGIGGYDSFTYFPGLGPQ